MSTAQESGGRARAGDAFATGTAPGREPASPVGTGPASAVGREPASAVDTGPASAVGTVVAHRRYVPYSHAHYAGNLVDGAYVLALFGDVATELAIRTDGDEGLFASYSDVQFIGPLHGGDVIEVSATLVRAGRRSREVVFAAHVVCRGAPERGDSAADVLAEPLRITTARGTVVVPG